MIKLYFSHISNFTGFINNNNDHNAEFEALIITTQFILPSHGG